MRIEDAKPGTRIIGRHVTAHPRTVVAWENDGFGRTGYLTVVNDAGRRSRIKAGNLYRYDVVSLDVT